MLFLVILKQVKSGKASLTVCKVTLERFLAIMNSEVCKQISFFPECFFTSLLRANEGSLACV